MNLFFALDANNCALYGVGVMTFKQARIRAKLTQAQLAAKADVWQQTISRIERGLATDTAHRIVMRLCRAMDVDPQDIKEFGDGGRR